ncbi:MAG TPA: MarR family winged helix-turn-helix transcriptional regulator [Luteibacter sp.]|nr:MarR family winged helix-turn-helix transcriptional regulator [Luteibacter sp.]
MSQDFIHSQGVIFLPHILRRLANRFIDECAVVSADLGIDVPQRLESTVQLLLDSGTRSVMDIAGSIGQSHPFVIKGVKELKALKLVDVRSDPKDKRRTLVTLTAKGKTQAERLVAVRPVFEAAYLSLMKEADADVFEALWRIESALKKTSFAERVAVNSLL